MILAMKEDSNPIEVTPEMIAAGGRALAEWDREFETFGDGAASVFRAMEAARLRMLERAACEVNTSDTAPKASG